MLNEIIGYTIGIAAILYTYVQDRKLKSAVKKTCLPKVRQLIDRMEEEKKVENIGIRQQTVMHLTQQDLEDLYKTIKTTLHISD